MADLTRELDLQGGQTLPIASVQVPTPISRILAPFLTHAETWTLHYPVYLNTFCLAHHLAACFAEKQFEAKAIRPRFVRNDWWHGRPRFNYKTDIEIFVGVDSTISELIDAGHQIDVDQKILFTRYNVSSVFQRLDGNGAPRPISGGLDPILVTDVFTTAKEFRDGVKAGTINVPHLLSASDAGRLEIRNAWDREIGDFFAENPKIYLFGAPMTQILIENSVNYSQNPKYIKNDISMPSIPTYYVLRCNRPKLRSVVLALGNAITDYYRYLYDPQNSVDPALPERYARIALTCGEANPFPEIYQFQGNSAPASPAPIADLRDRYKTILARHHA